MARLRYFDDRDNLHIRTLGHEKFLIGRAETCQIPLVDDLASREHSRLDRDPDGRYRVRDLGSRNKTYVNGEQITETLLTHGDMLRVGNHVFEFLDDTFQQETLDLSSITTPDRNEPAGTEWVKMKQPVTLPLDRVAHLSLLTSEAVYPARPEDVASAALGQLLHSMHADRGFIALRGENKRELRPLAHRGFTRVGGGAIKPVSETFVFTSLLQTVAGRYPQEGTPLDAKAGYAPTGVVSPIMHKNRPMGVLYADRPLGGRPFALQDLHQTLAAGTMLGELIAAASKKLAANVAAIGAPWLSSLRRFQQAATVAATGNDAFDVAARLLPGQLRCGDAYDVVHVSETRTDLLLVDAGGQGVAGLAQAHGIRTAFRTALETEGEPPEIDHAMSGINRSLVARQARQLVPCIWLSIDLDRGRVTYINAGCPPPLLMTGAKRLITLDHPSLLLGIDPNYNYAASIVDLPGSFRLVCHTDGLPETTNNGGDPFGSQRLHDLLLDEKAFAGAAGVIDLIFAAVDNHRAGKPCDDDALVVVVAHG